MTNTHIWFDLCMWISVFGTVNPICTCVNKVLICLCHLSFFKLHSISSHYHKNPKKKYNAIIIHLVFIFRPISENTCLHVKRK